MSEDQKTVQLTHEQFAEYMAEQRAHNEIVAAEVRRQVSIVERSIAAQENPKPPIALRDWFAGQALAGIASGHDETGMWMWRPGEAAEAAYLVADAMLAARTDGGDNA